MTLSRKDFFRQGFFSLGETLLKAGESVRGVQESLYLAPVREDPEDKPALGPDMVARADNRLCLAKNCGCFSCIENCEVQAISLVMGEGISIDAALCTGCGACQLICPLTPKALVMTARN